MLEAGDRQLLLDALRPPTGYRFDQGIGTTYSLDLLALLMAPVAFTFFDQSTKEEGAAHDSLAVLESLRRYANRLTLFCEAGRTSIPRAQYPQLAFIEDSVIECRAPNGGAFHPKLWVLRFASDGPVRFRVLCMSRNLVFAQAWDTMLVLDGEVGDRGKPVSASGHIAEFVKALPGCAVRTQTAESIARTESLAAELEATRFTPPEGFDAFKFWPIGIPGRRERTPFREIGKRLLIVSPFLTGSKVEELASETTETTLVSTASELAGLTRKPAGVTKFYVLSDRAQAEPDPVADHVPPASLADAIQLRDLHAKLYVTEIGAHAHIWTGSANASAAAFERNVEFLVELIGPRKRFGLDSLLLLEKDKTKLINLLIAADHVVATEEQDSDAEALERAIEEMRQALIDARLEVHIEPAGDAFDLSVWMPEGRDLDVPAGVTVTCWPSMLVSQHAVPVSAGPGGRAVAVHKSRTRQAITSFIAFEVKGKLNASTANLAFVLNLPLVGAPADRKEDVLRSLLHDRKRLMRFLMLLLSPDGEAIPGFGDPIGDDSESSAGLAGGFSANGLFELLLRSLDEAPQRLDHLASLLAQLRKGGDGKLPLPEDFDAIWQPILAHRRATAEESA